ncbi:hypothetical protein QOZ80_7BG0593870 [Eleusine coracana subsp. coracana]|nr:hypothetical protein QOZ80_7BG0593870 [Eleusine coracana subsp. coracana]
MRFITAYLLAELDASASAAAAVGEGDDEAAAPIPLLPGKDDVRRIPDSVGVNVDEDRLDMLFAELEGKDFAELMAAGREKLAYAPCTGARMAVASGVASGAGEAKEEVQKEEEKMEEEDDENMFNLFDDE